MPSEAQVGRDWYANLKPEFDSEWFRIIRNNVSLQINKLRPRPENIFRAFRETPPANVKCVILGQDPYPDAINADGLAFSSQQSKAPKSLEIIFNDLETQYGVRPQSNDLTPWAKQGVLLLNTSLTVIQGIPMSHSTWGWDKLISAVFRVLSTQQHVVYFGWGKPAQNVIRENLRNTTDNLVLSSHHPVAELYSRGTLKFAGRFKEANDYLTKHGKEPIQWIT